MKPQAVQFYVIHLIVVIIAIACVLMNGPMREGLPIDTSLASRMAFITTNRPVWVVAWLSWMFAALGLFSFCAILASRLEPEVWRTVGLALVGIGIAPDLIAEVIYAFVIPEAIQRQISMPIIEMFEVTAMHLTGFLGNGLYNLGGILLTFQAMRQGLFSAWVASWGMTAWCLGLLLSVAVALDAVAAAEIFTATSMVASTCWMLIIAHKVIRY